MSRRRTTPERRLHIDKRADLLLTAAAGSAPDQMMTTPETAAFLCCSIQFLAIGRISGYGPPCVHVTAHMVRYKKAALIKWLEQRRKLYARGYGN